MSVDPRRDLSRSLLGDRRRRRARIRRGDEPRRARRRRSSTADPIRRAGDAARPRRWRGGAAGARDGRARHVRRDRRAGQRRPGLRSSGSPPTRCSARRCRRRADSHRRWGRSPAAAAYTTTSWGEWMQKVTVDRHGARVVGRRRRRARTPIRRGRMPASWRGQFFSGTERRSAAAAAAVAAAAAAAAAVAASGGGRRPTMMRRAAARGCAVGRRRRRRDLGSSPIVPG